jgi:predicted permease
MSFGQDLTFALRSLWRAKVFAASALITLSLGLAGTIAMSALIRGVLLRPLPVRQQDRLIVSWKELRTAGSARYPFGDTEIEAVARDSRLLESAAGVDRNGVDRAVVIDGGAASYASVGLVTGGFFEVLGVRPILGRGFAPADDRKGAEGVIVITEGWWQRRYGGSPSIIGHRVRIDERPFTIVGVMPSDLDYPTGIEIWRLTTSVPSNGPFGDAARREVNLIGRLRPAVTLKQAETEIASLSERLDTNPRAAVERDAIPVVRPFVDVLVGDARVPLLALFAAVGLVLAIAMANVANLLLMRGETRRAESAVRAALGASPFRVVTQQLAETAIIAVLAGIVGLATAWWIVRAVVAMAPDGLPRLTAIHLDLPVILFSTALVVLAAILSGLISTVPSLRDDLVTTLAAGSRGACASANRGRRTLVVLQVALAVAVLSAAGLLTRSVLKLQAVELGIPADRLVLVDLYVPPDAVANRSRHSLLLDQAIAQLSVVADVDGVTPVNIPPFLDRGWDAPRITAEGQTDASAAANPSLNLESIHPNYFQTLGIPILQGRAFLATDRDSAPPVAIISERVADVLWPGQDPIGKRLKLGRLASPDSWRTVVGIAASSRYRTLQIPRPTVYLPDAQFQMTATNLVMRTSAPLERLMPIARARLHSVDPNVRIIRMLPFIEMLRAPLARPRFNALLLGIFGMTALLLAAVGLHTVMAAYIGQRDREIAIRLALGASPASVARLVLVEVLRLAGVGGLIGLAGAVTAGRLLRGLLFEVDPLDPATLSIATVSLIAAAALATYVPLRRGSRVDPAALLRAI